MADFGGNMALNIEQRLGQKLTNEQQLLWNYMLQRWPNLTFEPLYYSGSIVAHELTVYAANKLYIAYQLDFYGTGSQVGITSFGLMNELNANKGQINNSMPYWDATAAAARYTAAFVTAYNVWFSRIVPNIVFEINFIGYRLAI